jgi:hypothetical protein
MRGLDPLEAPWKRAFWFGTADARVVAMFRMGLGLVAVLNLLERLRDFHAFFGPAAITVSLGRPARFSMSWLFHAVPSVSGRLAIFGVALAAAALLAAGLRPRVAALVLLLIELAMEAVNPWISGGGDTVIRLCLAWALFMDLGACASLDVRFRLRPAHARVPVTGLRFLQMHVALIYLTSCLAKSGATWTEGHAVGLVFANPDWSRGIGPMLATVPHVGVVLTYATLAIEAAMAPLMLWPWRVSRCRAVALGLGLALHGGIFLTMGVGAFSLVMPVALVPLLRPQWLDRIWTVGAPVDRPSGWRAPTWAPVLVGALMLTSVAVQQVAFLVRSPLPNPLRRAIAFAGLQQRWAMFAPDAPRALTEWTMPGRLDDGSAVELTRTLVPELVAPSGYPYRRWRKMSTQLGTEALGLTQAMGRYVCARARAEGVALKSFELYGRRRVLPTSPTAVALPPPAAPSVALRQTCR